MVSSNLIERSRLEVQKSLDSQRLPEYRKKLGQFSTPYSLAMEMLQYACSLNQKQKVNFLDPGFGTGVFYSACLNVFSAERIQKAVGYEIDQAYWKAAIDLWNKETRLQLINADFTKTTIPNLEKDRFDLLICNPPYIRHHAMTSNDKKRLVDLVDSTIGIRPSGYSGMYCYFLLLSHYWMSKDGIAGWLIPSEFMDVNYGKQVKQYLLNKVTLLRIHRFNPSEVQFDDALVSSAIVWLKNSLPAPNHTVEFSYGGTFLKPSISKLIPVEILRNSPKWSGFTTNSYEINENKINKTLGDFFTIKRGIATGANEFFVLTQEKAERLQIPKYFLKPILPPPRKLRVNKIESDEKVNKNSVDKLFLLSCELPDEAVEMNYPALWAYLLQGKEQKVNERYICQHRTPWYSQENRAPSPFLFNIIGRLSNSERKPYRFILNKSQAVATNNYLMLYPKQTLQTLLNQYPELIEEIWLLLNAIPIKNLLKEGRVYGGGLYKIEPKELMRVSSDKLEKLSTLTIS